MTVPRRHIEKRRTNALRYGAFIATFMLSNLSAGCGAQTGEPGQSEVRPSVEILALSRGRGVPQETQIAFQRIKSILAEKQRDGLVVASKESVIGLEGEKRLCVVFRDKSAASATMIELGKISRAIDLLQIKEIDCRPNRN